MSTILLAGCAMMKSGRILLIRKKDRDYWELPGGIVKSKEGLEEAAVAKTKEQIGTEPTVVQQFTVLEFQKNGQNIEASIFECDIDPEATFSPGENIGEVKWMDIKGLSKEKIGDDVKEILEEI
jgi:ADP-ribose pyrophosphatase YjhB (NUDIX family)